MEKKQIKKYLPWAGLVLLVALLTVMPLLASSQEEAEGPRASILQGTAERKSIETKLVGGGTLASEKAVSITVPTGIKLTEYLASNGDTISRGDPIAKVDRVSVMSAIIQVQQTLDALAADILDASADTASDEVAAQAGGTVKLLYAGEGDSVQDVMLEYGALAVLSLDGKMSVKIERRTNLSGGDAVCVRLEDGTEAEGIVESNLDGLLTITIEDKDYAVGASVSVTTEDGDRIGSGVLSIHSPWNAVAYSGTVADVLVEENDKVSAGRTLLILEDTGKTAEYDKLVSQHEEYRQLMLELFQMYESEYLTAPCDGILSGVDENGTFMLSSEGTWTISLLGNILSDAENLTYTGSVAMVKELGDDGWILLANPTLLDIEDLTDLSRLPLEKDAMTEEILYQGEDPVYHWNGETWDLCEEILPGDILLFAVDSNGLTWIILVDQPAKEETPEVPSEPTEPTAPSEPNESADPSEPIQPEQSQKPDFGGQQGTSGENYPQMGAGGFPDGMQRETEDTLYSLETYTAASVTPQTEMTLSITIDEWDISDICLGQTAQINISALPGAYFTGTVTAIGSSGSNSGGNSKFTVELTLEKNEEMLPGMSASAVIILGEETDALSVPVAALCETGTQTILYTGYDEDTGTLTDPVTVTAGVSDGEYVQILSGLNEGDTFFYAYYDTLEISNIPDTGGFFFGR